ncbi:uracil-DNA glycosylase [Tunturibacter empetritectus]|uniref:Type-4 uracil-DNA glycosylase n=1 Tax=Tunturiibacter lichenicola TaxID=2051959 RepID=A0A7W8J501_9BACT|nr:uracil-DNA glycosylase [Edaphobacter lichenicola]MBB5342671.1 DNA polymerase [Edaphobacter lichenicola]
MAGEAEQLRAYVEYLRDMGVHDFYRRGEPVYAEAVPVSATVDVVAAVSVVGEVAEARPLPAKTTVVEQPIVPVAVPVAVPVRPQFLEPPIAKLVSFDDLVPMPAARVDAAHKAEALAEIKTEIGDCTRCPLAYAGRRTIVFGDGDANARLMFVGEGPGADEDTSGIPFVGKAGQLLNNMIQAMGLKREEVYIANIVKCRPPANRVPEPVEANTCDQFLLQQIDVVQPQVIVALGATAAMYLLGVKQSLSALRGRWHSCRGAKLAVTYHPAFLLRDPAMKGEAWKDLQMVMRELGLKSPAKS